MSITDAKFLVASLEYLKMLLEDGKVNEALSLLEKLTKAIN